MTLLAAILNAALAVGVIVMVVAPLGWAILTQHRDHPRPAAGDGRSTVRPPQPQPRRPAPQAGRRPVIGRA